MIKSTVLALGLLASTPVHAQVKPLAQPLGRTTVVQALTDCRKLTDDAARLACYDKAAGAFDQAEAKGDIVVVDREQATAVRRQAFGFTLPSLSLFDRPKGEGADKGQKAEPLDRVTATLARAYRQSGGRWVMELEDGAVWTQTDVEDLPRGAKTGSKVEIRKAAMGSYFVNVDGQRAIRASRTK